MSLPFGGSTAPAISSPLLAWPSRPSPAHRSPLSTPSSFQTSFDSDLTRTTSWDSGHKGKGKERAMPEVRIQQDQVDQEPNNDEIYHGDEEQTSRRYPPPKQPLSPRQLGRIAQSFGIVIPSLPFSPSPTSSPNLLTASPTLSAASASSSRLPTISHSTSISHSPYLLAVVPPLSLLNLSASTAEDAEKRSKRWRRGRLIPLQPTLGGMLLAIAREFGLPSTQGIDVYLAQTETPRSISSASSSASFGSVEEASGPLISAQTWTTLFSTYLHGSVSRGSTPATTPRKSSSIGRDRRLASPRAIVGTIEFDVDRDVASWFDEWSRLGPESSRTRKLSSVSDGGVGIRELRLVRKVKDKTATPFLRELDRNRTRTRALTPETSSSSSRRPSDDTTQVDHLFPSYSSEYAKLQRSQSQKRGTPSRIDPTRAMSASGSFGEFPEDEGTATESDTVAEDSGADVSGDLLDPGKVADLLASPIQLEDDAPIVVLPSRKLAELRQELDKRGSAVVMSDELDDLEKLMRQLSPKEIRLTSPRMLTPRMAAKVASLEFPPLGPNAPAPRSAPLPAPSPLAATFHPDVPSEDEDPASTPPSTTFEAARLAGTAAMAAPGASDDLPQPSWPAVPYIALGSPGSPSSIQEYFKDIPRPGTTSSPLSEETRKRMEAAQAAAATTMPGATEWKPRRPVRPPTPNLDNPDIVTHAVSPDMVDVLLRSPPSVVPVPPSPASPAWAQGEGEKERKRSRSNSISLKGLKHMSSRTFGRRVSDKDAPPLPFKDSDRDNIRDKERETVGLWKGGVSPATSTFPGLRDRTDRSSTSPSVNEFGAMATTSQDESAAMAVHSLPNRGDHGKGFGRFLHFGRKVSDSPKDKDRHSHSHSRDIRSRRNLSIDGPIHISAPISTTHHVIAGPGASDSPAQLMATLSRTDSYVPGSPRSAKSGMVPSPSIASGMATTPASPRSVRRKPVPEMEAEGGGIGLGIGLGGSGAAQEDPQASRIKGSMSLHSVASFVLEDPPKRRMPQAKAV
ncbi:hypothetical protein EHS25_007882 [Saitozyma podzolica]|uniref:Proteophosphoglycan ppg4 n=1 Tax=Saitozyma podzolica TaxID=1890683 RepID=A0A427YQY1_9TREE|nr:hypothetical protein EHS25_007882 [Saitozyma podzolica]